MKKFLLFLIFPFCVSQINAGNYQEMLKPGNKWNVLYNEIATCGGAFAYTTSLYLAGDTVIESKTYKKLRQILISADRNKNQYRDTVYVGGLRENVQKQEVYIRYPGKEEELLYSFNASICDTIKVVQEISTYSMKQKTIRFVTGIDTFTIGGITGKKISVTDTLFYEVMNLITKDTTRQKYVDLEEVWYESIGTLHGLIPLSISDLPQRQYIRYNSKQCGKANMNYEDLTYTLLCFWNGNSLLYHNPDPRLTECEYAYTVGIKEQFIEGLSVYPNPTKGLVEIKSESGIEWAELYDSIGNRIATTTETKLDLSSLSSGVYIVKVTTLSGTIKTVKIVKQ